MKATQLTVANIMGIQAAEIDIQPTGLTVIGGGTGPERPAC